MIPLQHFNSNSLTSPIHMTSITPRIKLLLTQVRSGIYEKETETAMALLAAMAGESILLLGPPGVAKSMVARRMKDVFAGAKSFEYLMSRFSTPDEIFGPVSISKLKTSDSYERAVEGFLPTADIVFLDEIWKAGPAIQNTLLTAINEKLFRNGNVEMRIPLKLLVAASNELPAKGEGLEALWDRFLVRIVSKCIESEDVFREMLEHDSPQRIDIQEAISREEYETWQKEAAKVTLSPALLSAISAVRMDLKTASIDGQELTRNIYVSDRRWKHIAGLLKMSAFLQGRSVASVTDLLPMYHCLWNEPDEVDAVRNIVLSAVFSESEERIEDLCEQVKSDLFAVKTQHTLQNAKSPRDRHDEELLIVDRSFYQVENHGAGNTLIPVVDFKRLPARSMLQPPVIGYQTEEQQPEMRTLLRLSSPSLKRFAPKGAKQVTLCRDNDHIYINGVAFTMRREGSHVLNPSTGKVGMHSGKNEEVSAGDILLEATHYETDAETLCNELETLQNEILQNIFVDESCKKHVRHYVQQLYKQIALCRVDIRKLLYNE